MSEAIWERMSRSLVGGFYVKQCVQFLGAMKIEEIDPRRILVGTGRAVDIRLLSVALALLLLGVAEPGPVPAEAPSAWRQSRPSPLGGLPPDTVYVARMDTLIVIGYRADRTRTATPPDAEEMGRSPFVTAAAGGTKKTAAPSEKRSGTG